MDSKLRRPQTLTHRVAEEISTSSQTVLRSAEIPKSAIRRDLDMNSSNDPSRFTFIWTSSDSFGSVFTSQTKLMNEMILSRKKRETPET